MLVLLPPSEGKTAAEAGEPADLGSLAFAEQLSERREELLNALDPQLREAPAAPAAEVYTGVLFQRLELPKQATLLAVRAFTESQGDRKVVSHMAKAVRGDVARALLQAKKAPADAEGAAAIAEAAGFTVELNDGTLDVIV